jgi:GT2 family glycosyltransferase
MTGSATTSATSRSSPAAISWRAATATDAVGLLDEDFFFFGEETDWCRRFLAHGYAVRFAPVGTITHFGGGSSKSLNSQSAI